MSCTTTLVANQDHEALSAWLMQDKPGGRQLDFDISIVTGGEILALLGPSGDPNRKYALGCFQDVLLGAYLAQLEDAGDLQLLDAIGACVPALMQGAAPGARIRFADLISRSSGAWVGRATERKAQFSDWQSVCDYLNTWGLEFPPGSVVTHSLIERAIVVRALEHLKGPQLYEALIKEMLGPASPIMVLPPYSCLALRELYGSIRDFASMLDHASRASWYSRLKTMEHARPIVADPTGKPSAARATAMGLVKFESGLWGVDADSADGGFLGLRLDPDTGTAVIARFATFFERDRLLARICADLFALPPAKDTRVVGHLRGVPIEKVVGRYTGMLGNMLNLTAEGDRLCVRMHPEDGLILSLQVETDGTLTMRHGFASLWVEPISLPGSHLLALRIGQDLFIKYD